MDVTKFSFCILLFAIGLFKNSVHGEVKDDPVTEEIPITISSELIPVPEIAQIQLDKYCRSFKCLQQITNLTEIDKQCRVMSNSNRDRLCYCCGGSKSYHTFGEVCRRYCRQEKNEAGEFFEPCKPSQNTSDENNDNKFNPDKPFPVIPILVQENELDCDFSSVANVTSQSKDSKENIDSPTTNLRPRPDLTKPAETNGQQKNRTQTEGSNGDKDQQTIHLGNHEILNDSSQGSNNISSNGDDNSKENVGQQSSQIQSNTFFSPNGDDDNNNSELEKNQHQFENSEFTAESSQGSNFPQVAQQSSQSQFHNTQIQENTFSNLNNNDNSEQQRIANSEFHRGFVDSQLSQVGNERFRQQSQTPNNIQKEEVSPVYLGDNVPPSNNVKPFGNPVSNPNPNNGPPSQNPNLDSGKQIPSTENFDQGLDESKRRQDGEAHRNPELLQNGSPTFVQPQQAAKPFSTSANPTNFYYGGQPQTHGFSNGQVRIQTREEPSRIDFPKN